MLNLADDHLLVKALPVVEVVEIDRVEDLAFVRDSAGAEDGGASGIGVDVASDGSIQFRDGGWVEGPAGLGEDPRFEL